MVKNGVGQSDHGTLKLILSENEEMEQTDILYVDIDSQKSKVDQICLGMVKNGCGQSGHGTLKLNVSQK